MDISHSRPHRSYDKAPTIAFDRFERAVDRMMKAAPFAHDDAGASRASVGLADARQLPLRKNSVDIVITSPPYLNAIDYMRGHKFSLVWMGYSLHTLRTLRSTNVGTETAAQVEQNDPNTENIMQTMCRVSDLSTRQAGMLRRYIRDMRAVLSETTRVLRPGGKAVFVVGNCTLRDTFVYNSKCIECLAYELGMVVSKLRNRPLPETLRYLPPPESLHAGKALRKRLREEVILTLLKD